MYYILPYLGIIIVLAIVVIGIFRYRQLSRVMKVLFYYFILDVIVSYYQFITALFSHTNNLWTTHMLIPFEYGFFMWIFSQWMPDTIWKRLTLRSIPWFIGIWIVTVIAYENLNTFNMITFPMKSLLLVIVSVYVLYVAFQDNVQSLFRLPQFWISSGVLVYNAGNIMFALFSNQVLQLSSESLRTMWTIHNFIGVTAYLFYVGGFLCRQR